MKRVGVWLSIGIFSLSLVYLFKPGRGQSVPIQSAIRNPQSAIGKRLNINTASVEELESLPGIGPALANRIVEYREKHGPFARPEDLLIIEGLGEKKYRALADLIEIK
jgi:competence protein ComEA